MLPVRPVLYDARNLPAPIVSVIIGLPLPVFATACILLPVACPSLARRLPAAPAVLPAPASLLQPACSSQPAACPPPARRLPAACPPLARRLPAVPAALPLCRSARSACSAVPASLPALPFQPACLSPACRSSQPACHLPAAPACPPFCPPFCLLQPALPLQPACLQKKRDFPKSRFFIIRFGPSSAPPRLSARQSRKPSRTSCSRILAQSATGCFSPSTNRSGHPRLQSSM